MRYTFWIGILGVAVPAALQAQIPTSIPPRADPGGVDVQTQKTTRPQEILALSPVADSAVRTAYTIMLAGSRADSASIAAAVARADTGRMQYRRDAFSRYTPRMCIEAMETEKRNVWRKWQRDTSVRWASSLPTDTLPTAALEAGKRCVSRFTVANTPPGQLFHLQHLLLLLNDDATARAVSDRRFSLAVGDTGRAEAVLLDYELYSGTHGGEWHFLHLKYESLPTTRREADARAALAKLDAMGAPARVYRLMAYNLQNEFDLETRFDTAAMRRDGAAILALRPLLTPEETSEFHWWFTRPYINQVYLALLAYPDTTVHARFDSIYARATRELQGTVSDSSLAMVLNVLNMSTLIVGHKAAPIAGTYFYDVQGRKQFPAAGQVTVYWNLANNSDLGQLARLRRLQEKFGDQGVQVVVSAPPLDDTALTFLSPKLSPADEANTVAWYYLEHLRLPFTLVVPDSAQAMKNQQGYQLGQAIIGRDGRVLTQTMFLTETDATLEAMIRKALEAKTEDAAVHE